MFSLVLLFSCLKISIFPRTPVLLFSCLKNSFAGLRFLLFSCSPVLLSKKIFPVYEMLVAVKASEVGGPAVEEDADGEVYDVGNLHCDEGGCEAVDGK